MQRLFPVVCLSCLIAGRCFAGSATWSANPVSGDWNTTTNWMPNTVPNGRTDTATFDVSSTTEVSLSAYTEVDSILFEPSASAFTVPATVNELSMSNQLEPSPIAPAFEVRSMLFDSMSAAASL